MRASASLALNGDRRETFLLKILTRGREDGGCEVFKG